MPNRRTRRLTLALVLAASLNLGWQFYQMDQAAKERQRVHEDSGLWICYLGPSVDQWARMYTEVCLIIAFVGSFTKGFKSLFLTVIGLTGAAIIFILWRQFYFQLAEVSGGDMRFVEHIGGLMGANYLDIAIAATIVALILIHLYDSLLHFRSPREEAFGR